MDKNDVQFYNVKITDKDGKSIDRPAIDCESLFRYILQMRSSIDIFSDKLDGEMSISSVRGLASEGFLTQILLACGEKAGLIEKKEDEDNSKGKSGKKGSKDDKFNSDKDTEDSDEENDDKSKEQSKDDVLVMD